MGHRLTRIYTRTGDDGTTGLASGLRVPKDHARIEAMGAVDELNSALGALLAENLPDEIDRSLSAVQHDLFDLGGELSLPGHAVMEKAHVERLEEILERYNAALPPLKDFVLPGGARRAALAHLARAICRRAERRLVALSRHDAVPPVALQYLNRLSDLLFVVARTFNRLEGAGDVLWQQHRHRREDDA